MNVKGRRAAIAFGTLASNKSSPGIVFVPVFATAGTNQDKPPKGDHQQKKTKGRTAFPHDSLAGIHSAVEKN